MNIEHGAQAVIKTAPGVGMIGGDKENIPFIELVGFAVKGDKTGTLLNKNQDIMLLGDLPDCVTGNGVAVCDQREFIHLE